MINYEDMDVFTTTFQELIPKLMHHLETEEMKELTGLGITPGQINALLVLYMHEDLTMRKLSTEIFLAESAATRLVDRLVKMNLVNRRGDSKDRRIVRVYLTDYGRELAGTVFDSRARRFRDLAERLSPGEREGLVQSITAVLHAFDKISR